MRKIEYPVFAMVDEIYYGITEKSTTKVSWGNGVEMVTNNRSEINKTILKNRCSKDEFSEVVYTANKQIRHNPYPKLDDEEWCKNNLFVVKDFIPKYYYQTDGVVEYWYLLISDRSLTVLIDGDYVEIRHSNKRKMVQEKLDLGECSNDDFHKAFTNAKMMITEPIIL